MLLYFLKATDLRITLFFCDFFFLLHIDAVHSISVGGRNALYVCLPTVTKSTEEDDDEDLYMCTRKSRWRCVLLLTEEEAMQRNLCIIGHCHTAFK